MTEQIFRFLVNEFPKSGDFVFLPVCSKNWILWPLLSNEWRNQNSEDIVRLFDDKIHHDHSVDLSRNDHFVCALVESVDSKKMTMDIAFVNFINNEKENCESSSPQMNFS